MRLLRFPLLVTALVAVLSVTAQDVAEQKKIINDIKKAPEAYLYVDQMEATADEAKTRALHELHNAIDKYVAAQRGNQQAADAQPECIVMPRGDKFRGFAYIKKSDLVPQASSAAPQPVAPVVKSAPVAPVVKQTPAPKAVSRRDETHSRLAALTQFSQLKDCLARLKQEGRIGRFGKHKDMGDVTDCVLIIYNRDGGIDAVLSEGSQRTNLKTAQSDDVSNYPGRGAFAVKVND